jgi:hypothetical protein
LFLGASLIAAVPYALYALGRSDALHYVPAYWALMPCVALLASGCFRLFAMRPNLMACMRSTAPNSEKVSAAAVLTVLIACIYFWGSFPLDRILTTNHFAARYELARQQWHLECASNPACEKENRPSLRNDLKQASQPLREAGLLGFDSAFIAACRDGVALLSYADGWIYATAGCTSPIGIPSVSFLATRSEFKRTAGLLNGQDQILFDPEWNVYADWKGGMLLEIKARLIQQGFTETGGCGRFSVLSRVDPAPLLRKLCG